MTFGYGTNAYTWDRANRMIQMGSTTYAYDGLANLDNEQVRAILKRTYPEVAHATVRETTLEDGTVVVYYQAVAGRKG